jgi:hypothetical protein
MSKLISMPLPIPALTRFSTKGSQYDFSSLVVGGNALIDVDVVDASKAHSRVSSALTAYKKRTGDKSKFTVRITKVDGKDVIAVWKIEDAPVADAAAAAPAATADIANASPEDSNDAVLASLTGETPNADGEEFQTA